VITDMASQLGCDHIVMGTTRRSSFTRTIESSVMNKVIELTNVPVVVIAGDKASIAERYAAPAAIGTGLALLLFAAVD
jgi:20S proteasome alpha/beta subunit